ncbi:hypothetical protein [Pedobacter sp. V48]|nr:hypothetical protein [Pedobacter sp. V48]
MTAEDYDVAFYGYNFRKDQLKLDRGRLLRMLLYILRMEVKQAD